MTVRYRCLACRHDFSIRPHPVMSRAVGYLIGHAIDAQCPECGHLYVERIGS